MLQNPDASYDENITIYASSPEEAIARCERLAKERSQGAIVICLGCVKMTKTTGRYSCTIRVEPIGDHQ